MNAEQALLLAITIVAVLCPAIGIPVYLGLRHERWKRQLEHTERMRALELGRPLPGDESWLSPTRIGLLIAVAVPIGVFCCAMVATAMAGFQEGIWIPTAVVSVTAVLCGSKTAGHAAHTTAALNRELPKPVVEEDAYDVVSARG
jgi:hypothetical protein